MKQVHTYEELKELQKLPLGSKVERADMLIIEHLQKYKRLSVSCSWGKDSMVLLHLVRNYCPNILVVYHNTGVEYPQNLKYRDRMLEEWGITNYVETKPIYSFWECVKKYGYPSFRRMGKGKNSKQHKDREASPRCCYYLKEKPAKDFVKSNNIEVEFVGLQASESMVRRLSFLREGEAFNSKGYGCRIVRPLMIWTEKDIWEYHKAFNIPINPVYKLMKRNGCMPCTGFKNWKEVMAKANPKMYNFVSKKMGEPNLDCFFQEGLTVVQKNSKTVLTQDGVKGEV